MPRVHPEDADRMEAKKPRIAVAGFQHESNSFSPIPTTLADFIKADAWPGLTQGPYVIETFSGLNIPIGGCVERLQSRADIVPVLWANAEPGHHVQTEAFETIAGKILDGLGAGMPLDGVFLDLHGAMITEEHEDGEGELLSRVRNLIGPDIPVVISLDLHANLTPEMVSRTDAIAIFRTYPHLDMAKTGSRAADLLLEIIDGGRKPHTAFRKLPFMISLQAQRSGVEPAGSLYRSLPENGSCKRGNVEIAMGFPPGDIAMCGPALVATDFVRGAAESAVDAFLHRFLEVESDFAVDLATPAEAVSRALRSGRSGKPVVLADVQDNSGAGGCSDSTALLAELASHGARGAAIAAVCDAEFVETAHRAGIGAEIRTSLGGQSGGPENPPFTGKFLVTALSDGNFAWRGEMMNGVRASLGPTAAVRLVDDQSDIRIVATGQRVDCFDRALFSHLGIEPVDMAFLVVKSGVHFRADFEGIASEVIPVDGPGCNPCRLQAIPYTRLRAGVRLV